MRINLKHSYNFGEVVETVSSILINDTTSSSGHFYVVHNDLEPSLVLEFLTDSGPAISFLSSNDAPSYSLDCTLGFKVDLLNQMNKSTTKAIVSFDQRIDGKCKLVVDDEEMQITNVSHNNALGYSYLTVIRGSLPQVHYRNSKASITFSRPDASFLDAAHGLVRISWSTRDTSKVGVFDLKVNFSKSSGGVVSKWTVVPIEINVKPSY